MAQLVGLTTSRPSDGPSNGGGVCHPSKNDPLKSHPLKSNSMTGQSPMANDFSAGLTTISNLLGTPPCCLHGDLAMNNIVVASDADKQEPLRHGETDFQAPVARVLCGRDGVGGIISNGGCGATSNRRHAGDAESGVDASFCGLKTESSGITYTTARSASDAITLATSNGVNTDSSCIAARPPLD